MNAQDLENLMAEMDMVAGPHQEAPTISPSVQHYTVPSADAETKSAGVRGLALHTSGLSHSMEEGSGSILGLSSHRYDILLPHHTGMISSFLITQVSYSSSS